MGEGIAKPMDLGWGLQPGKARPYVWVVGGHKNGRSGSRLVGGFNSLEKCKHLVVWVQSSQVKVIKNKQT